MSSAERGPVSGRPSSLRLNELSRDWMFNTIRYNFYYHKNRLRGFIKLRGSPSADAPESPEFVVWCMHQEIVKGRAEYLSRIDWKQEDHLIDFADTDRFLAHLDSVLIDFVTLTHMPVLVEISNMLIRCSGPGDIEYFRLVSSAKQLVAEVISTIFAEYDELERRAYALEPEPPSPDRTEEEGDEEEKEGEEEEEPGSDEIEEEQSLVDRSFTRSLSHAIHAQVRDDTEKSFTAKMSKARRSNNPSASMLEQKYAQEEEEEEEEEEEDRDEEEEDDDDDDYDEQQPKFANVSLSSQASKDSWDGYNWNTRNLKTLKRVMGKEQDRLTYQLGQVKLDP